VRTESSLLEKALDNEAWEETVQCRMAAEQGDVVRAGVCAQRAKAFEEVVNLLKGACQ
jgi:hypothetical protein